MVMVISAWLRPASALLITQNYPLVWIVNSNGVKWLGSVPKVNPDLESEPNAEGVVP